MSRLTDLLSQAKTKDPELASELEREFKVLSSRRSFGLNFERHRPESVELPGRPVRKGDNVHILPPRGTTAKGDQQLWRVREFKGKGAKQSAQLELLGTDKPESQLVAVENLVVVAEFHDYIFPGLVSTGKVERGGGKPFHTVINGENFHVLEALTFTHRGKIDAIYIDPPYNSGAKDWKYNNDYVDGEDLYRHSKWLAMIERRLTIADELLNKENSVLIVTIDEKEYLRLGLLLEQMFPGQRIQMISSLIKPSGVARGKEFYRVDEYIFFVYFGRAEVIDANIPGLCISSNEDELGQGEKKNNEVKPKVRWGYMLRSGSDAQREDRRLMFYPILVDKHSGKIVGTGEYLPAGKHPKDYTAPDGLTAVWPIREDGSEGRWQMQSGSLKKLLQAGHVKIGSINESTDKISIIYLPTGLRKKLSSGEIIIVGKDKYGGIEVEYSDKSMISGRPKTQWTSQAHSASDYGTSLLRRILPKRKFPFPKSLYAVEDTLRFFVADNPNAIILDFFAGSCTTTHAVMRLNKQDGGRRQCISITNNEVAAEEQNDLRKKKLRPGDDDWEKWGICEYITKPRIKASITGKTPEGEDIVGEYKFTDKFPISEGFEENAEFFTLTYETPIAINHSRAFGRIAPLLWMRAGSKGRCIEKAPDAGWELADTYGLLIDLDQAGTFCKAVKGVDSLRIAYIVTDDDRRFQSVTRNLPDTIEPVRLYESYLNNFRFSFAR